VAKHTLTRSGIALICAVAGGAQAAEVKANIGYTSEYIFRGISQSDSSAMEGLYGLVGLFSQDFEESDSGETSPVLTTSKTFGLLKQEFTS
jgi:Bacterial protein of unknown function (Gcw_chp)